MPNGEKWLTLSEVAEKLGVHEGTVRRWSDAGLLPSFRTPGGHRRFLQQDVTRFISQQRVASEPGIKQLEKYVLTETKKDISVNLKSQPWHTFYQKNERALKRRAIGQKLLAMLLHYTVRDENNETYLYEAKNIMFEFGREARSLGMSLHDTAQAYLFFRRSLTNAVFRGRHDDDPDTTRLIERMHEFWDDILLSIIEGYSDE